MGKKKIVSLNAAPQTELEKGYRKGENCTSNIFNLILSTYIFQIPTNHKPKMMIMICSI